MITPRRSEIFAERLRELCGQKPSYAQVARDLGINRQQLSRYLAGNTVPRDGILTAFADYFAVPVNQLFSEQNLTRELKGVAVNGLEQILASAKYGDIRSEDLEEGFYLQFKKSFAQPGRIFSALVLIKNIEGVFHYRRKTSAKYAKSLLGSDPRNTFEGVFFRQGTNIALIDKGTLLGDLTFHVMEVRYHYNGNIKHGYHINVPGFSSSETAAARFVLQKIPTSDSVWAHARNQGFKELADLPNDVIPFFSPTSV